MLWLEQIPAWDVAPYAGAWIETENRRDREYAEVVAPYAGAWIETYSFRFFWLQSSCRPLRGGVD